MKPQPALLVVLCLVVLAGCARTPPDQRPVEAESPIAFNLWRAKLDAELTPEEWRWFDVALQEFKFQLMLDQKVSGSEAIDTAVRERINGRKWIEVTREGLQAHLKRKTAERDEMEAAFAINAKRKIRPGDDDTRRDLAMHQENLRRKLATLNNDITAVATELARLKIKD